MNKRKILFIIWIAFSAGLFYFWKANRPVDQAPTVDSTTPQMDPPAANVPVPTNDQLSADLKGRIDSVLERIEGMWDPTGSKVKEVGAKMDDLEKALEENKPKLAEKILSEIETIVSEK